MIGKNLGQFRILEQLGAGGMGVVFRARDEKLERDVAIKVLPAGLLADEDARRRFRNEALALAKLNHPNIGTLYDFDFHDGTDFLVMEYVAGGSLLSKLSSSALGEKETAVLGLQIAAALEEAHEHGIIHRDLKPGNIALSLKGQVKVLDFGLAKLVHPSSEPDVTLSLTEDHAVKGTLPYMAPEQLRGEPVDARTDIYALGVVLYEMAVGQRPFQGETAPQLSDSILHAPPPAPSRFQPRLSAELERIILKCLEKGPENRYQSAKELAVDLRRLGAPSARAPEALALPAPRKKPVLVRAVAVSLLAAVAVLLAVFSLNVGGLRDRLTGVEPAIDAIAVLPLENLSGDPEQEYFAAGMHEALITELSRIHSIKVISRTSVTGYKGTTKKNTGNC